MKTELNLPLCSPSAICVPRRLERSRLVSIRWLENLDHMALARGKTKNEATVCECVTVTVTLCDPASSSGASFFAWFRKEASAKREWLVIFLLGYPAEASAEERERGVVYAIWGVTQTTCYFFFVIFNLWGNSLYRAMPFAKSHNGIMALGFTYFGISVPSIFLGDLLGNTCLLARVQKVMVCDSWLMDFDPLCLFRVPRFVAL